MFNKFREELKRIQVEILG